MPRDRFSALQVTAFRRFWLGSMASIGSTQLLFLGLGWLMFNLTESPMKLGLVGVCIALPMIVVMFFSAAVIDTCNCKRLLIFISFWIATLLLVLTILDTAALVRPWNVFVVASLFGCLSGIDWPLRQAILPSLIAPHQLPSAIALNSMNWQGARMVMPAFGGILIGFAGTASVFLIGALGYLLMGVIATTLPADNRVKTSPHPILAELLAGVRFVCSEPLFYTLIGLTWVFTFFGTSYLQILPALAIRLGTDSQGYGALVSASGIGALTGTLLVLQFPRLREQPYTICALVAASVSALFIFAILCWHIPAGRYTFVAGFGLILVAHLFASCFFVTSMTMLQQRVPSAIRARVMSLHGIGFTLMLLGGLFSGTVAQWLHPPAAIVIGVTIVWIAVLVALRKMQTYRW